MTPRELLTAAIGRAGSEKRLGDAIGYSQHAVWMAKKLGRVSPRMARAIDAWSGGAFPASGLCPEIFGRPGKADAETARAL